MRYKLVTLSTPMVVMHPHWHLPEHLNQMVQSEKINGYKIQDTTTGQFVQFKTSVSGEFIKMHWHKETTEEAMNLLEKEAQSVTSCS